MLPTRWHSGWHMSRLQQEAFPEDTGQVSKDRNARPWMWVQRPTHTSPRRPFCDHEGSRTGAGGCKAGCQVPELPLVARK